MLFNDAWSRKGHSASKDQIEENVSQMDLHNLSKGVSKFSFQHSLLRPEKRVHLLQQNVLIFCQNRGGISVQYA